MNTATFNLYYKYLIFNSEGNNYFLEGLKYLDNVKRCIDAIIQFHENLVVECLPSFFQNNFSFLDKEIEEYLNYQSNQCNLIIIVGSKNKVEQFLQNLQYTYKIFQNPEDDVLYIVFE